MSLPLDDITARDLRFTVAVVLAAALAREDRSEVGSTVSRAGMEPAGEPRIAPTDSAGSTRFEFRLLAAAARPELVWPAEGWRDARHLLAARVESIRDELRLHLQAEGYAALQVVAGKAAHLRSPEGTVDQHFRFDHQGRGLVVLGDTPDVRRALGYFEIRLIE
jgi:hypothetical protein